MTEDTAGNSTPTEAPQETFKRFLYDLLGQKVRENIAEAYSNHIRFEMGELDLKILFSQLDQSTNGVNCRAAITMAWAQAKMLSYFLRANLAVYEGQYGTIRVPAGMLPPTIVAPDDLETNPTSRKIFEAVQGIRSELMEEQLDLISKQSNPAG